VAQENEFKERKVSPKELPLCSEYLAITAKMTQLKLSITEIRSAIQQCHIQEMQARNALPEVKRRLDAAEKEAKGVAKKFGLPESVELRYDAQKRVIHYREIEDPGTQEPTRGSSDRRGSAKQKDSGTNGASGRTAATSSKKRKRKTSKQKTGPSTKTS